LRLEVKYPWYLGEALAKVIKDEQDLQSVWLCLEDDAPHIAFAHGFIYQKLRCEDFSWMQALVQELEKGYSDKAVANALFPVHLGQELWNYIDSLGEGVQREYWLRMKPNFNRLTDEESIVCISKLLEYRRFTSAMGGVWLHRNHIPSDMLIDILRGWGTEESQEPFLRFHSGRISSVFRLPVSRQNFSSIHACFLAGSSACLRETASAHWYTDTQKQETSDL